MPIALPPSLRTTRRFLTPSNRSRTPPPPTSSPDLDFDDDALLQLLFSYGITKDDEAFQKAMSGVLAIKRMVRRWMCRHRMEGKSG